ncbi:O-succinylbenzoic acid--CoA ligase [Xylanibacter ruminicola]|jgi:O-succinylbenzoic acid--CoA ligase|uniref:O-succinylbenzoic acid--CoA ligase-like protein n=2 Tax=Xylanibacter ruminicola TaxID=839 RepID=D5ETM3_XYLR2|nr:AMP-binding protein [Xylanibacter ruminicola]ADE83286.1 O-succinylbenzoic acid--CoA ligase-like protein [Xylanibacter ruminicola 23]GJG34125.1 O-succinylbenzoic acid--CoA ligase [Xylanibacter ruminicola]SEH63341.1 O-succinylbenzoic acid--CoA ligase [Xylanibacter ruminicola]
MAFIDEWNNDSAYVEVKTSGSTGEPKRMLVEKRRMLNSARITCDFLGLKPGDTALLCMSTDYIAGKMMVVRSIERGLKLIEVPPCGHPLDIKHLTLNIKHSQFSIFNFQFDFAAMVPMQVYNSLQVPEEKERLMAIRHLIIGGGAIDEAMEAELRTFPHAVWSTYGMTETLSHIALRRISGPEASEWYMPFPTVKLSTTDEGCLVIDAPEVCAQTLTTNDIVELKSDGRFRIRGRKDNVICSGGIKIQIEEVEQILKKYMRVPYIISKRKDEKFGEIVVLLTEGDTAEAQTICEQVLPKYHQPKVYLHVNQIPLTETGKPARKRAEELAKK